MPPDAPPARKFSVMWNNTPEYTRNMSSIRVTLRDPLGDPLDGHSRGGITCDELFLDQVHIKFRPSDDITTFAPGDAADLYWRTETMELYVATTPGQRFNLYAHRAQSMDVDHRDGTVAQPHRSLQYSSALFLSPAIGGDDENYWNRTYRPLRDIPVALDLHMVSEMTIDLLWPILQGDDRAVSTRVPDYRILLVICDFSTRT